MTLNIAQIPSHSHTASAVSAVGTSPAPSETAVWATSSRTDGIYKLVAPNVPLQALGNAGGDQSHENRSPILTLNYCIALIGIFPTHS